jgi:hypothetical protein
VVLRIETGSSLDTVSQLGFVMEMYCVFCEVWNEFLNIWTNYRRPILRFRIYIFMRHLHSLCCFPLLLQPGNSPLCPSPFAVVIYLCIDIGSGCGIHGLDWGTEASSQQGQLVKTWVSMPTGFLGLFILNLHRISLAPGREADHSPPSSAEVKNGGAIPPLPNMS